MKKILLIFFIFPTLTFSRQKVAVVLSGGGARSISQIGVLKVLEENKIPIDMILGNSMGSIIGGLYCAGYSLAEIESIATHTDWEKLLSISNEIERSSLFVSQKETEEEGFLLFRFDGLKPIFPKSISKGNKFTNFLNQLVFNSPYYPETNFDKLKISFRAISTDLISGNKVIFSNGSLIEAMRSSASVPLLFSAFKKDSMLLLDGGFLSNIPTDIAKNESCDVIIAINTTSNLRTENQMNAPWEYADQMINVMQLKTNQSEIQNANVLITPELGNILSSDFSQIPLLIEEGKKTANLQLHKILSLVKQENNTTLQSQKINSFQFHNNFFKNEIFFLKN